MRSKLGSHHAALVLHRRLSEGATSVNTLVVPVGKPVKLLMPSKDVITGFRPQLAYKNGCIAQSIYYDLVLRRPNIRSLRPLLYCRIRTKRSSMIGKVRVVGEREYAQWLESSSKAGEGMSVQESRRIVRAKGVYFLPTRSTGQASTGPFRDCSGSLGHCR